MSTFKCTAWPVYRHLNVIVAIEILPSNRTCEHLDVKPVSSSCLPVNQS